MNDPLCSICGQPVTRRTCIGVYQNKRKVKHYWPKTYSAPCTNAARSGPKDRRKVAVTPLPALEKWEATKSLYRFPAQMRPQVGFYLGGEAMIAPLTLIEQSMLNADHAVWQTRPMHGGTCYWQGQEATSPYWRRYWQERKAEDAHDPEPV